MQSNSSAEIIDPRFAPVADLLGSFAKQDPGYSAQLAVYHAGVPVLDLAVGPDCTLDSLTGVFSCSKGAGAMVMGLLVQDGVLDLEAPVALYWPEFAAAGKASITVAQLLSHQAGLLGVEGGFTPEELTDSRLAAAILAAAEPVWSPGSTHGYHALSMGVFMEELARRTTGESLQQIYARLIRIPHDIDFHLGLPEELEPRYTNVLAPLQGPPAPFMDPFSLLGLSVNSTAGFEGPEGPGYDFLQIPNVRAVRAGGISSLGGVASARGLARLYAAASTGIQGPDGSIAPPILTAATQAALSSERVFGADRCVGTETAFGIVFMKPTPSNDFGSWRTFGHDGTNGALGYADPAYSLGFGYVPTRAEEGGTASRAGRLSTAVRQVLLAQ
ncbi:serine hydrolase domain-containing protein [Paeniglutamicibacter cryotolerans]|nr:serine hydrolase domain-containing protein [Paeniglutamicibacter cryotolerans]